jgi:hypothetical protein
VAYTPKAWLKFPNKTTAINDVSLKALEQRVASYATAEAASPGAYDYEAFRVKQRGAGANMSVDVGLAATEQNGWLRDAALGIWRYQYNGAQINTAIPSSDPSNPRVDRVCLLTPASSDSIVPQVVVLAGTPTTSATLDNLAGAQAVPAGYELLADVLVGAGAGSIVTASIRDRRRVGGVLGGAGGPSPYFSTQSAAGTGRDEVFLVPHQSLGVAAQSLVPTTHDNFQGAYAAFLPRKIVGATRLRWKYAQGATPATTNYVIGLYDASGRALAASAATAFAGAANSFNERAETITAQTFEPGWYLVFLGVAALTAASAVSFTGIQGTTTVTSPGSTFRQVVTRSPSGGTTLPASNTLALFTDVAAAVGAGTQLPLPVVSLSVG